VGSISGGIGPVEKVTRGSTRIGKAPPRTSELLHLHLIQGTAWLRTLPSLLRDCGKPTVAGLGNGEVRNMATSSADFLTRRAGSRICPAAGSAAGHDLAGPPFPMRARRSSHSGASAHRIGIFCRQVSAGDGARRRSPP